MTSLTNFVPATHASTPTYGVGRYAYHVLVMLTLMGIPPAKLADQGNRSRLIAGVIIVWSLVTALCGFTVGFASLLVARIGVGIGEAGSAPAVQSQRADYFHPRRRASMIGLQATDVYLGSLLGFLLGFLLGGWINRYVGWRTAFMALGAPGIVRAQRTV